MLRYLRPTFLHGGLILLGGIAFAFFGCLGAIAGFASNSASPAQLVMGWVGSAGFLAGCLAVLVGGLLLVIAVFNAMFGKRDRPEPPGN
jgi:hypothetical protein